MTLRQKKDLFLFNYAKSLNKTKASLNVFSGTSLYQNIKNDPDFAQEIYHIELRLVHSSEESLFELLSSLDEKIKLATVTKILNSKIGVKNSNFSDIKNVPQITIDADKVEYQINS